MDPRQIRNVILIALAIILLAGSRTIANFVIEYQWWKEVGQVETWLTKLGYRIVPAILAGMLGWFALLWSHQRGLRFAGVSTAAYRFYSRIAAAVLLLIAVVFISASVDPLRVMAFMGSLAAPPIEAAWEDPVFGRDLSFYLFNLPFYSVLLRFLLTVSFFSIVVFWATARGWQLFQRLQHFRDAGGRMEEFDPGPNPLLLPGATKSRFALTLGSVALIGGAAWFFLGRYTLLLNHHPFMTGMDFVDEKINLPLRWFVIAALLISVPLLWQRKVRWAGIAVVGALAANAIVPGIVRAAYVRPNELELERPYIQRHLDATVEAFALNRGSERVITGTEADELDVTAHSKLIDNIRLWDVRAFTSTITQIQALRPYYRFADIDIDRYQIDGRIKQVMLSPREVDIDALPADARASWINTSFFYTHGYGLVMSEVNRTTPDGLPMLLVQDAPPVIRTPDIQITRPEIYYGEVVHDPVFANTDQREFDYPLGNDNITSHYEGDGGFPIYSLPLRLAAALREGQINILLTGVLNENSRMMIYRNVRQRLQNLAEFIHWDIDPYLTITDEGRLIWIVDGYTTSDVHPYSQPVVIPSPRSRINYIRNSVKATVDAYNGEMKLYIYEDRDPIVQAYAALFPKLFTHRDEMPADIRSHTRYPLALFDIQAEMYRTYHMSNPDVFYNKEDVWDVATALSGDTGRSDRMSPTYIVATLPGEREPEFILMLPFTPRGKDNLTGWIAARCDGDKLGELIYYKLSKQQLVFGPNQIESRINQEQEIARDLTLWNQQGSRVLRGELLALPVRDSFLYVESIYIQAENARMPQLRKVVLAMGNRLVYENTFEEALARLSGGVYVPEIEEVDSIEISELSESAVEPTPRPAPDRASSQQMQQLAGRLGDLRRQAQDLVREIEQMEREFKR